MATIRSNIVANIKTTLETITIGNGYATTVGGVYVWKPATGTAIATPFAVIAAMSERKDQQSSPYYSCDLTVQIECFDVHPEDDPKTGWAKLEQFLADVEKALMVAPYRGETHNTVVDTILESVSIKPFDPDDGLLNGSVTVTVRYRHNAADPSGVPG